MNIIKSINALPEGKIALAIGNFDGCHYGHQKLINTLLKESIKIGAKPVLLTFTPHPHIFFHPESSFLIDSREEKIRKIKDLGIDTIVEVEFTAEIQVLKARIFLEDFLLKIDNLSLVLLGHDFALGSGKENAKEILEEITPASLIIKNLKPVFVQDTIVSSTLIRKRLRNGEIELANTLLGEKFTLGGNIINGAGVGKKKLVPTANLAFDPNLIIPGRGVYFTTCLIDNESFPSITNIGSNPTVNEGRDISVETHLLDFNENIYGKALRLTFHKKCRNEKKFNSLEELKIEIKKNIESRRLYKC